jgi:hypothetical protein
LEVLNVCKDGVLFLSTLFDPKICKGADNATLKDLANKDPNKKWSYANVPMDTSEADKEKLFDQIWVDMEANMMD